MCVGVIRRVYVKLCVSVCVEDAVCNSGLGTFCFLCLCVNIIVRVVLSIKHRLHDSPSKWGSLSVCVCVFVHECVYSHIQWTTQ